MYNPVPVRHSLSLSVPVLLTKKNYPKTSVFSSQKIKTSIAKKVQTY